MAISIEVTMNRLVTDRWTVYRRQRVTAKTEPIRLKFKEPINAMQLTEGLMEWQKGDDERFNKYTIFKCVPTAEEEPEAPKKKR